MLPGTSQQTPYQLRMTLNFSCPLILCRLVIQVYVPHILELIEMSPVNSDLQLGALRLLTNLSVTDQHQHLLKTSIRLLLSLLVVGNEELQVCLFLLGKIILKGILNSSWCSYFTVLKL